MLCPSKDGWIYPCSRRWSLWLWRTDLLQCSEYFFQGSSVELVLSAIDVANDSCSIHNERCRMRDADRIVPKCVIKAVCLGCGAVLIKKKRKCCGMPGQELQGLPNPATFLGGDINQIRAELFNFFFVRLKLSHPFPAVGSPRAAQKFDNQRPAVQQARQRK